MSLVYDHDPKSGLVVAREGAGEAELRRALKQLDPRLMLDYAIDAEWQRQLWQVLCRVSSDHPPLVVCRWRDEQTGEPLPLSHGLVEKVRHLHVDSRAPKVDELADNDRLQQRARDDAEAELAEYVAELIPRLKGTRSSVMHRGEHLKRRQFPLVTDIR